MTSYLLTIATNSRQTCIKMCMRDMPENGRCRQKNRFEKIGEKPYGGGGGDIHPPLLYGGGLKVNVLKKGPDILISFLFTVELD